jgi:hypothetical protein
MNSFVKYIVNRYINLHGLKKIPVDYMVIGKDVYICNFDTCKLYLAGEAPQHG